MNEDGGAISGINDMAVIPMLDVRVRSFRGTTLIARREFVFELSESAALLWRSIDGGRTVAELVEMLCAEYGIDSETAQQDCHETLAQLSEARMLRMQGDEPR